MTKMGCLGLMFASVLAAMPAHADVQDWYLALEKNPQDLKQLRKVYVGVGFKNALVHVQAEAPTPYGIYYGNVGQFLDGQGIAVQAGVRYPYLLTGEDQNGYYVGGFVGHVENDRLDGDRYNRLGAGLEFSYLFLNKNRSSAASVGIGAGIPETGDNGVKKRSKPMAFFSYTFGVGAL